MWYISALDGFVLRLLMMQNLAAARYSYMELEATLNDSWYDPGQLPLLYISNA
jgi:hypothetical protein